MARVNDTAVRAIFERYGYDPDDPARGRDIPDRLLRVLARTRAIDVGEPLEGRSLRDVPPAPRELEALELLACGHSYKEIATIQRVTLGTSQARMRSVRRKLGAHNAAHAVTLAIAQRLIPRETC